jgi:outer membrane biogenesis lipoprotein LolB
MYEKIKAAIRNHTDAHRLVFWYDAQATHGRILEELDTEAEVLEAENNEWWIKYHVLEEKPQQHFLIFIPSPGQTMSTTGF